MYPMYLILLYCAKCMCNCFSKVHILGSFNNIRVARTAICNLILGMPHSIPSLQQCDSTQSSASCDLSVSVWLSSCVTTAYHPRHHQRLAA